MPGEDIYMTLDRSWFYEEQEKYLSHPDFLRFEEISGIKITDITSKDQDRVRMAQKRWEEQSVISNEIRKSHFGFAFPYIIYSQTFHDFDPVPNHNVEFDKFVMTMDMCDSLRRRHIALSHGIIPYCIEMLHNQKKKPLTVKNLGSGIGLDSINAMMNRGGIVGQVLNYDTSKEAIHIGLKIIEYMEQKGTINAGTIQYIRKSMTDSDERADLIIMIGVICGLQDFAARYLLVRVHSQLNEGGLLIVSSSNHHMKKTDPIASFLIQHIGSKNDPDGGWSLNFRTKEQMEHLLMSAGFTKIETYSDTAYPGKKDLPDEILFGIDTLPAKALGYNHQGKPLSLPSSEILKRGIAYNWIAVATK